MMGAGSVIKSIPTREQMEKQWAALLEDRATYDHLSLDEAFVLVATQPLLASLLPARTVETMAVYATVAVFEARSREEAAKADAGK